MLETKLTTEGRRFAGAARTGKEFWKLPSLQEEMRVTVLLAGLYLFLF